MGDCKSKSSMKHLVSHPLKNYSHKQTFWSCSPSISAALCCSVFAHKQLNEDGKQKADVGGDQCCWKINIQGLLLELYPASTNWPSYLPPPQSALFHSCWLFSRGYVSYLYFSWKKKARKPHVLPTAEHIHLWNSPPNAEKHVGGEEERDDWRG